MTYSDNTRLGLIHAILCEKRNSSRAFVQYMASDREYGQSDVLHMREAHFIMAVGPGDGKTMSEVAKEMSVTQGAVSQTAGRLEKKGYIRRSQAPGNRRQILAVLTERGRAFYQQHLAFDSAKFTKIDQAYLSRFTEEELRLILEYEKLMTAHFLEDNEK